LGAASPLNLKTLPTMVDCGSSIVFPSESIQRPLAGSAGDPYQWVGMDKFGDRPSDNDRRSYLVGLDLGMDLLWSIQTYLITNIGKYLPGNVWHFYGRIRAAQSIDVPQVIAILSTLMEPLLMAASALILAAGTSLQTRGLLQGVTLVIVLIGVHPRILNPMLTFLSKKKAKGGLAAQDQTSAQLKRYPLKPLLGEMGFLLIRGLGFLFALAALSTIEMAQVPQLLSAFSCAWLLGLVIPGAPGGLGVFEATAIALLDGVYPSAIILSGVALYRVISVLSEAIGALLAWLYQAFNSGDFLKVD